MQYVRPYQPPSEGAPVGLSSIRQLNGQPGVGVANFSRDVAPGTSVENLTSHAVSAMTGLAGVVSAFGTDAAQAAIAAERAVQKFAEAQAIAEKAAKGGTLTPAELAELQAIADRYKTEIHVIGSRAAGAGRNIETDLPVGKGPGTRSDIDVRISGEADIASGGYLSHDIANFSGGAAKIHDPGLPQIPSRSPVIKITPREN